MVPRLLTMASCSQCGSELSKHSRCHCRMECSADLPPVRRPAPQLPARPESAPRSGWSAARPHAAAPAGARRARRSPRSRSRRLPGYAPPGRHSAAPPRRTRNAATRRPTGLWSRWQNAHGRDPARSANWFHAYNGVSAGVADRPSTAHGRRAAPRSPPAAPLHSAAGTDGAVGGGEPIAAADVVRQVAAAGRPASSPGPCIAQQEREGDCRAARCLGVAELKG